MLGKADSPTNVHRLTSPDRETMIFRTSTPLKQKLFQEKRRKSLYSGEKCGEMLGRNVAM